MELLTTLAPRKLEALARPTGTREALSGAEETSLNQNLILAKLQAVRQLPADPSRVVGTHHDGFTQAPHALRLLRAEQMALAGMHPHDFARGRDLETFGRAAVRLQLEFYFCFSCHDCLAMNFPVAVLRLARSS
jgi:hypothetical protein